jgi:hypothetical protein
MINYRITGDVRPSRVTVYNEFNCASKNCGGAAIIKVLGEHFLEAGPPSGWVYVAHYPQHGGDWYCPRHEIKIEDRKP